LFNLLHNAVQGIFRCGEGETSGYEVERIEEVLEAGSVHQARRVAEERGRTGFDVSPDCGPGARTMHCV